MMKKTFMFITAGALFSIFGFIAGCSCECEVECTDSGQTFKYRMVEMKRSECENMNEQGNDSCHYRCADR
jgi:hypothetical protein